MDENNIDTPEKSVEHDQHTKPKKCVDLFPQHFVPKDLGELGDGWLTESELKSELSKLKVITKACQ